MGTHYVVCSDVCVLWEAVTYRFEKADAEWWCLNRCINAVVFMYVDCLDNL